MPTTLDVTKDRPRGSRAGQRQRDGE